jgi:hypothetical protein
MPTLSGGRLAGQVYGDLTGSVFEPSVVSIANVVSGTLKVARGGTGAQYFESSSLILGSGLDGFGYLQHPTASGLLNWDSGSYNWTFINFSQSVPYDISGEFIGYPSSGQVILRTVAARQYNLSTTNTDHYFRALTGSADCDVFSVNINGTKSFIIEYTVGALTGTVTYQTASNLYTVNSGDILTVVAPTGTVTVGDLFFTLKGNL